MTFGVSMAGLRTMAAILVIGHQVPRSVIGSWEIDLSRYPPRSKSLPDLRALKKRNPIFLKFESGGRCFFAEILLSGPCTWFRKGNTVYITPRDKAVYLEKVMYSRVLPGGPHPVPLVLDHGDLRWTAGSAQMYFRHIK